MRNHTKVYFKYHSYDVSDWIGCEICNKTSVDIHHIDGRGEGMDVIENLAALCRVCHDQAGNSKEFNEHVKKIHLNKLK